MLIQGRTAEVRLGHVRPGYAKLNPVMPSELSLGNFISC
jgi:hypothetical protein